MICGFHSHIFSHLKFYLPDPFITLKQQRQTDEIRKKKNVKTTYKSYLRDGDLPVVLLALSLL